MTEDEKEKEERRRKKEDQKKIKKVDHQNNKCNHGRNSHLLLKLQT